MKDIPATGKSIRCSSLPRILACPASKTPPKTAISSDKTAADIGSAMHDIMAACLKNGWTTIPEVMPYCAKYNVEAKAGEVAILAATTMKWLREQLEPQANIIGVEDACQTVIPGTDWWLTGHADLIVEYHDEGMAVIDWKSGYVDWGYKDQLLGYVFLQAGPDETSWRAATVWPRLNEVKAIDVTKADLEDLSKRMAHAVQSDECKPGPHQCQWCPRAHECEAHDDMIRASATALMECDSKAMTVEGLASLYPQAKLLKKALDDYDAQIRSAVMAGPVPIGNGMVLDFSEGSREKILITTESIDALTKRYGEKFDLFASLEGAITVGKGRLQECAAEIARKEGAKIGDAKKEIMEIMRGAGAVESKSIRKLVTRKEK